MSGPYHIRVTIVAATISADGGAQRAFFFAGYHYVGTDTLAASANIAFVRRVGATITLHYALYRPVDSMCCPSAGTADVRFHWDGAKLEPLDSIPAFDPKAPVGRR